MEIVFNKEELAEKLKKLQKNIHKRSIYYASVNAKKDIFLCIWV